jgi:hypothetical protein
MNEPIIDAEIVDHEDENDDIYDPIVQPAHFYIIGILFWILADVMEVHHGAAGADQHDLTTWIGIGAVVWGLFTHARMAGWNE